MITRLSTGRPVPRAENGRAVHAERVALEDDADRYRPLPPDPDALPRVLGRGDALGHGFSRQAVGRRLRSGTWRTLLPRTYLTVDSMTTSDRLTAALVFAGPGAALSGYAALWASGVRGVSVPTRVLVLVPPDNRVRSHSWVCVQRSYRPIVTQNWTGPRRVEVARAAADAARSLPSIDDVRALISRVVRDQHCTVGELAAELADGPRRDSALLRQAVAEVTDGAASAPEARAARILRRAGITGFVQNARLVLSNGSVRVVDFYWPQLRACLEIDSVEWHADALDWRRTWDRHLELTTDGHSVVHRPPSALRNAEQFAADVKAWLTARAVELGRRTA